jgi:hypothetical protein
MAAASGVEEGLSPEDVIYWETYARKLIMEYKLLIHAIDNTLYQAEADQDILLFAQLEVEHRTEAIKFGRRNSSFCQLVFGTCCTLLFCVCLWDRPNSTPRSKDAIVADFGRGKQGWTKAELLAMIEALQTALDLLPQQGPQRLRAAINDCEFQVQQKWRASRWPVTIAVPASQPPPAAFSPAMQPANAMQEGPPKQNLADQLAQLSQLRASGALSQEQFDQAAAKVIAAG